MLPRFLSRYTRLARPSGLGMQYCEQCGSTSHDAAGFCRGCGARLSRYADPQPPGKPAANAPATGPAGAVQSLASTPLAQPQVKNVWVAVLLALFAGPLGMIYSTVPGALVMSAATVIALFVSIKIALWLLPVVCAVWAGQAARSANRIY